MLSVSTEHRVSFCFTSVAGRGAVLTPSLCLYDLVSFEEFQEGSKQDPTIVQALSLYDGLV